MAAKKTTVNTVRVAVPEKPASEKQADNKKSSRAHLYSKFFTPAFVDSTEHIQQVSGFETPVYTETKYYAGV